jgi:hypothetical protein
MDAGRCQLPGRLVGWEEVILISIMSRPRRAPGAAVDTDMILIVLI